MDASVVDDALGPLEGPFAKINGVELTPGSAQLVVNVIKSATDSTLKAMRGDLELRGKDANAVRTHLLTAVHAPAPLPQPLVTMLRKRIPAVRALGQLSEDLIDRVNRIWPHIFGQHAAGLALALDDRPKLHQTAHVLLNARPDEIALNIHTARDILLQEFRVAFHGPLTELTARFRNDPSSQVRPDTESSSESPAAATAPTGPERFRGRIAEQLGAKDARISELTGELQTQRDSAEQRLALREQEWINRLDAERERSSRIPLLEVQVTAAEASKAELLSRLAAQEAQFEAEVQKCVERELSRVVRPWLAEARRLEKMSATRTDLDLQGKVSALLAQQKALDMKYGSRARLRQRLKEFEAYAEQLRNVREDSLKPHPELEPLLRQVESEIRTVRRTLDDQESPSPLLPKLLEAIQRSSSGDELDALATHFNGLCAKGVFDYRDEKRFVRQLHKAYDRLKYLGTPQPEKPRLRSGRELRQVLGRNQLATVYIDGNNLLLNPEGPYFEFLDDGEISQSAEDALIADVAQAAGQCPAVKFRIVFDSREPSEDQRTPNVVVQRSGGIGTDRADSAIVSHLAKSDNQTNSYVVTEDRSLRDQAVKLGGVYASTAVWMVIMEAFGIQTPDEEATLSGAVLDR